MKTFREWMLNHFERTQLRDMVDYGASNGFSGIIYYHETVTLYKKFQNDIWEMLYKEADAQGLYILQLISSFQGARDVGSHSQFANLLVWYAAEKMAYELIESDNKNMDE